MQYRAEISRVNPTCFLFLIDQSKSMTLPMAGAADRRRCDAVAEHLNKLLYTLVLRCVWGKDILDRFYVGVVGYGGRTARPALGGGLAGRDLVPISEIARNPLRVEQFVENGATVRRPVWFEPVADGKTPMVQALDRAGTLLGGYLAERPGCFPPLVFNITDGEASDGVPEEAAERLRGLSSQDGPVLLFNAHLSSSSAAPVRFPDHEGALPDEPARMLFRMSSCLPEPMHLAARQAGFAVSDFTRGFVFNADLDAVITFLDIGTRPAQSSPIR